VKNESPPIPPRDTIVPPAPVGRPSSGRRCRDNLVRSLLSRRANRWCGEAVTRTIRWCSSQVWGRCSVNKFPKSTASYAYDPRVEERTHTSQKPEAKVGAAPGVPARSFCILGRSVRPCEMPRRQQNNYSSKKRGAIATGGQLKTREYQVNPDHGRLLQ